MARSGVRIDAILVCETIRQETDGQLSLIGFSPDRVIHADLFGRIRASALYIEAKIPDASDQCELVWERSDGKRILHVEELIDTNELRDLDLSDEKTVGRVPIVLHGPSSISPEEYGKTFIRVRQAGSDKWKTIDVIEFARLPDAAEDI